MSTLVVLVIGMLIGWAIPQPAWVRSIEASAWNTFWSWINSAGIAPPK